MIVASVSRSQLNPVSIIQEEIWPRGSALILSPFWQCQVRQSESKPTLTWTRLVMSTALQCKYANAHTTVHKGKVVHIHEALVHHQSLSQITSDQRSQPITHTSIARDPAETAVLKCPIAILLRWQISGFRSLTNRYERFQSHIDNNWYTWWLGCVNLCSTNPPWQRTPDRAMGDFAITIAITIASLIARSGALRMQLCSVPLQHVTIQVAPTISPLKCIIAASNITEIIFTVMWCFDAEEVILPDATLRIVCAWLSAMLQGGFTTGSCITLSWKIMEGLHPLNSLQTETLVSSRLSQMKSGAFKASRSLR